MRSRLGLFALSTVVASVLAVARAYAALLRVRRSSRGRPRRMARVPAKPRCSQPVGYLNSHLWGCACLRLTAAVLVSAVGAGLAACEP